MKIAAAIGMAVALIALVVVALNMESKPKVEPVSPKDRVKPQVVGAGQTGGTRDPNFRTSSIQKEPFRAISKVTSVSVGEIEGLGDDSFVIGVAVGKQARAYPLTMLSGLSNAVVNDELGGKLISVTWSDACESSAVFARKTKNLNLLMQSSGNHWRDSLLMQDESGSLWSQLTTECKRGSLGGNKLQLIPSTLATWSNWKTMHPETSVMNMDIAADAKPEGEVVSFEKISQSLIGFVGYGKQKGYRRSHLYEHRVIHDEFEGQKIVLIADPDSHTVQAFEGNLDEKVLEFRWAENQLTDVGTNSQWDPATGVCTSGQLAGKQLRSVPVIPCLVSKWREINRDTDMWSPRELDEKK
jgi:hypothetical protein